MSNHHHAPLKVKDLETSFVGGRQTATSTPSGKATNKAPAPASTTVHKLTDYDKALSKLSKNYRGTPYEAALKQLLEEKAKNQGNKRDIDEVPSPEKVSAQMKSVQMGRMVTSAVLDSHLNPALDEKKDKNRINKLAKPNPKNIYVKKPDDFVSTNHIGRQTSTRPVVYSPPGSPAAAIALATSAARSVAAPAASSGLRSSSPAQACKSPVLSAATQSAKNLRQTGLKADLHPHPQAHDHAHHHHLHEAGQHHSQQHHANHQQRHASAATGPRTNATAGAGASASASASVTAAAGNGGNSSVVSVSLNDFNHWLKSNQKWNENAHSRSQSAAQRAEQEARENAKPRMYQRSKQMTELYQSRLKEYRETGQEESLLRSFISAADAGLRNSAVAPPAAGVTEACTFKPAICRKSAKMVAKRDQSTPRSYDLAIIAPYEGPAKNKVPIVQRKRESFVGLLGNQSRLLANGSSRSPSPTTLGGESVRLLMCSPGGTAASASDASVGASSARRSVLESAEEEATALEGEEGPLKRSRKASVFVAAANAPPRRMALLTTDDAAGVGEGSSAGRGRGSGSGNKAERGAKKHSYRTRSHSPRLSYSRAAAGMSSSSPSPATKVDAFAMSVEYSVQRKHLRSQSPAAVAFGRSSYNKASKEEEGSVEEGKENVLNSSPHRSTRGRSKERRASSSSSSAAPFAANYVTPRVSSPGFGRRPQKEGEAPLKPRFRSSSEPREVKNFSYMLPESKRVLEQKNDTFVDRVMTSVDKYYTHIGIQKQLRSSVYGPNNSTALLSSVNPNATTSMTRTGLFSTGICAGNTASASVLGPGQYSKTEIPGSKGVRSRAPTGSKGFTFSQVERTATKVIVAGKSINKAKSDWKTDKAKSGNPYGAH